MKIAVIGGGISGVSASSFLKDKGISQMLFEKSDKLGGLIKCERVNNILFHKVGGHVFNTKNPLIKKWFENKFNLDEKFLKAKRNAKIFFDSKKITNYPIENHLYQLDEDIFVEIIDEVLNLMESEKKTNYENFEDFLKSNFGNKLFELYFEPYNKKIWNTDLKNIPLDWLDGKLPMPNHKETIKSNIFQKEEQDMVHSKFYYPRENGSQFLIDTLARDINYKTNSEIKNINFNKNKLSIEGDEYDKLIYTGDVRKLVDFFDINDENLKSEIKKLKSNGTSNVLCEVDKNDFSWMYFPDSRIKPHRIIYTGNLSSHNNGNSKRTSCTIEFSGHVEKDIIISELKKLPGNPKPIAFNYEKNSYIIHDYNTKKNISKLKNILKKSNIYLVGRFAEWEYYNMDKAMEASYMLVNKLLKK